MASVSNLKKGDRVIYYGYGIPRRRGDICKVNAVSEDGNVVIIFVSDRLCMSCNASFLKKVDDDYL